jgi:hypothetical protein
MPRPSIVRPLNPELRRPFHRCNDQLTHARRHLPRLRITKRMLYYGRWIPVQCYTQCACGEWGDLRDWGHPLLAVEHACTICGYPFEPLN